MIYLPHIKGTKKFLFMSNTLKKSLYICSLSEKFEDREYLNF